mmetsp:Transcript_173412/g.550514  ORF Transcript_173412/g.550514 Transcript_173412/m.550514 type:complete len:329 (-) Transcript_173412:361-1347(-)
MADARDVLTGRAVLKGHASFADQLAREVIDDVHTQQFVRLLASQDLDEASLIAVGLGPGVGAESELPLLVLHALSLQLLLGLANPSDLGVRVDHRGHAIVVQVRWLARGDELGDQGALVLGLVRQHRASHDVADGEDAGHVRPEVVVHLDLLAIHIDAQGLDAEVVPELPATHANQDHVRVQALLAAACRRHGVDLQARARPLHTRDLGFHLEVHALLLQERHEILRDLGIDAQTTDGVHELHDRNLGAQPGPHRAQLQADDTAANDRHLLRNLLQLQGTRAGHDSLLIQLDAGQAHDVGACRQDEVLGLDLLLTTIQQGDREAVGAR